MSYKRVPVISDIANNLIDNIPNKPDYLEIFSDWKSVVGDYNASICVPYRITNSKIGKVLILKTIKGRGLEVQHNTCNILDSINKFLHKKVFFQIKVFQTSALDL